MRVLKMVVSVGVGVVVCAIGALVIGALDIRRESLQKGALVDFANSVVEITTPRFPVLFFLAMAAVAVIVAVVMHLWLPGIGALNMKAAHLGFVVASVVFVVVANAVFGDVGPASEAPQFAASGWRGWAQFGGQNSAVHLLALLSLLRVFGVNFVREPRGVTPQATERDHLRNDT